MKGKQFFIIIMILAITIPTVAAYPYRSYYTLSNDLTNLDRKSTRVQRYWLGSSVKGKPLYVYDIGNRRASNIIFVNAELHGGEHVTSEMSYYLIKWLISDDWKATQIRANNRIYVIPISNPDSYAIARDNANSVNLNRNFKYSFDPDWYDYNTGGWAGDYYYSEPETRQVARVMRWGVDWFIDLHAGMHKINPMGDYSDYSDMIKSYNRYCYNDGLTPTRVYVKSDSRIATSHADAHFTYGKKAMLYEVSSNYCVSDYYIKTVLTPRLINLVKAVSE